MDKELTKAGNHEILLNGARDGSEYGRALLIAKNEALTVFTEGENVTALDFEDGSRLLVDINALAANEAEPRDF